MTVIVSIDGVVVPPERAVVSVFDRGFLYGDGVFEVLRTYGGEPFALEEHLERQRARLELAVPGEAHQDDRAPPPAPRQERPLRPVEEGEDPGAPSARGELRVGDHAHAQRRQPGARGEAQEYAEERPAHRSLQRPALA